jgi:hypothetical protein
MALRCHDSLSFKEPSSEERGDSVVDQVRREAENAGRRAADAAAADRRASEKKECERRLTVVEAADKIGAV